MYPQPLRQNPLAGRLYCPREFPGKKACLPMVVCRRLTALCEWGAPFRSTGPVRHKDNILAILPFSLSLSAIRHSIYVWMETRARRVFFRPLALVVEQD